MTSTRFTDLVGCMLGRAFEAAMRDWAEGHTDHPRTRLDELLDILFGGLTPRTRTGRGRG
jgi:hypothetical protein